MSIRALLNHGRKNESILEKIADGLLYLPKKVFFFGKDVKIVKSGKDYFVEHKLHKPGTGRGGFGSDPLSMTIGCILCILYAATATVTSLPLGLGLALKKIIILTDNESDLFYKAVEERFTEEDLLEESSKLLENYEKAKARLEKYKTENDSKYISQKKQKKIQVTKDKLHSVVMKYYNKINLLNQKLDDIAQHPHLNAYIEYENLLEKAKKK